MKEVAMLVQEHGEAKAAMILDMKPSSVERIMRDARRLGYTKIRTTHKVPEADENFDDSKEVDQEGNIVLSNPVSATIDELLERFDIDKEYWHVTKSVINEWGSSENYNRQCKAWLQKIGDIIDWETFKKEFLETMKHESVARPPIQYRGGKHMLEINIFDLHIGKWAWAAETGDNYNYKVARKRFFDAIERLKSLGTMFDIDEIVFPFGNDFFNSDKDYPFPQTTAGTPMENDLRWQKLFKTGREMVIEAVNELSLIAPVKLIGIPGNHDVQKTFYLGDVLDVYYANNPNVTVDNNPKRRKYYLYGKNLLGFTHGRSSDIPEQRLLLLMPQEEPQLWAMSKYREIHCGDIHHSKKVSTKDEDHHGITIRYMKSLKGTDSWEDEKGYIGSVGGAEAFVWHRDNGLVSHLHYNL
jgi:hypothetical protein